MALNYRWVSLFIQFQGRGERERESNGLFCIFVVARTLSHQRQTQPLLLCPQLHQIQCSHRFANPMAFRFIYPQKPPSPSPNQTPLGGSIWSIFGVSGNIQRGLLQHTGGSKRFSTLRFIRKRSFSLHQMGSSQEGYFRWASWMGPWYYLLTSNQLFTFHFVSYIW